MQISKKLKIGQGYISDLLNGTAPFGKKTAIKFAKEYGLNATWLITGEGEMLDSGNEQPDDDKVVMDIKVFQQISRLTETVLSQQKTIEILAERKAEAAPKKDKIA